MRSQGQTQAKAGALAAQRYAQSVMRTAAHGAGVTALGAVAQLCGLGLLF